VPRTSTHACGSAEHPDMRDPGPDPASRRHRHRSADRERRFLPTGLPPAQWGHGSQRRRQPRSVTIRDRCQELAELDSCGSSRTSAWHHANEPANGRPARAAHRAGPGASAEVYAQVRAPARDVRGLLIRGFGVQVPGGAPVSDSASRSADFARVAGLARPAPSKSGSTVLAVPKIGHLPDSLLRVCSRRRALRGRDGECS
jgi:hypothetical protein